MSIIIKIFKKDDTVMGFNVWGQVIKGNIASISASLEYALIYDSISKKTYILPISDIMRKMMSLLILIMRIL